MRKQRQQFLILRPDGIPQIFGPYDRFKPDGTFSFRVPSGRAGPPPDNVIQLGNHRVYSEDQVMRNIQLAARKQS